jgi:hypothetical protein
MRRRTLLLPHLRRDPAFAITSSVWDTFGSWEWQADRRAGYLGDSNWDQRWALEAPNDGGWDGGGGNDGGGDDRDGGDGGGHDRGLDDADDDDNGRQPPPPPPSCDDGTGKEVRDDTNDFVGNVVYNVLLANERGEHYELPPELTEDEQLQVAILVSAEEEKRAFLGLEDALALSVAPPPPPGPPPRSGAAESPVRAPAPIPRPPGPPAPAPLPPGPPPPPMASWPWPQGPFIDLSGVGQGGAPSATLV